MFNLKDEHSDKDEGEPVEQSDTILDKARGQSDVDEPAEHKSNMIDGSLR